MTTVDEIATLENNTPCCCADGRLGLLIRWPIWGEADPAAGIQVAGEEEIRWVPLTLLSVTAFGTLVESSPATAPATAQQAGEGAG